MTRVINDHVNPLTPVQWKLLKPAESAFSLRSGGKYECFENKGDLYYCTRPPRGGGGSRGILPLEILHVCGAFAGNILTVLCTQLSRAPRNFCFYNRLFGIAFSYAILVLQLDNNFMFISQGKFPPPPLNVTPPTPSVIIRSRSGRGQG